MLDGIIKEHKGKVINTAAWVTPLKKKQKHD
jgi:hypothetical protein